MRIAIGADHAGFALKQHVIGTLRRLGHEVDDRGTHSDAAVDYPPICAEVAQQVTQGLADRGIVIGGSGQGEQMAANKYAREILLVRRGDGRVVQYGIMRIRRAALSPEVWEQIAAEDTPLGHVLIRHGVLRDVHLRRLWEVRPGPRLRDLFGGDATVYGRTAMIDLDGEPAVELLEIVSR